MRQVKLLFLILYHSPIRRATNWSNGLLFHPIANPRCSASTVALCWWLDTSTEHNALQARPSDLPTVQWSHPFQSRRHLITARPNHFPRPAKISHPRSSPHLARRFNDDFPPPSHRGLAAQVARTGEFWSQIWPAPQLTTVPSYSRSRSSPSQTACRRTRRARPRTRCTTTRRRCWFRRWRGGCLGHGRSRAVW